jgi:hypothetical protein
VSEIPVTRSTDILDAVWERVLKVTGFRTYRRGPIMVQTQPEDLPLIACYLPEDDGQAWGDSDVGSPKLSETVSIGVSGLVLDSKSDGQYVKLIAATDQLDELILRDPKFTSFDLIRGIERRRKATRSYQVGETPMLEFQWQITVSVINTWEPVIPDDLKQVHFETRYPTPDTDPQEIRQIIMEWDLTTDD